MIKFGAIWANLELSRKLSQAGFGKVLVMFSRNRPPDPVSVLKNLSDLVVNI